MGCGENCACAAQAAQKRHSINADEIIEAIDPSGKDITDELKQKIEGCKNSECKEGNCENCKEELKQESVGCK